MTHSVVFSLFFTYLFVGYSIADLDCGGSEVEDDCPANCATDYCPVNEYQEGLTCTTPDPCPAPACKCRFNYSRAVNGTCIPTSSCPPFKCTRPNEEYNPCPPYCPTDDCKDASPDGECHAIGVMLFVVPCRPTCRCIKGYWRKDGICVPFAECPAKETSES